MKKTITRQTFLSFHRPTHRFFVLSLMLIFWTFAPGFSQTSEVHTFKNVRMGGGGLVSGVEYSLAEQNLVYARTDVGGAYRWNQASQEWIAITDFMGNNTADDMGVLSIAPDPGDANKVYILTGLYTQSWGGTGAVYASSDKGSTWARSPLSIKIGGNENGRTMGERLQVDPNLGSTLFLGSSTDGLWKSVNSGSTWTKVNSFPVSSSAIASGGISFVLFDKTSGSAGVASQVIYVGVAVTGSPNLYRSTDGGESWSPVAGATTEYMPHHATLASNGTLYIAYANGAGPNGATAGAVFKYATGSGTWTEITPSPHTDQGGYGGISVSAGNPDVIVVSTLDRWAPRDEIYRSTDGGATWQTRLNGAEYTYTDAPFGAASTPHWIGDVDIDPFNENNAWFITGYGVFNSGNMAAAVPTWDFKVKGIEETVLLELASPASGPLLVSAMGDIDGFRHETNLDESPVSGRLSPHYGTNTSIAYAENVAGKMVRVHNSVSGNYGAYSNDGGVNWTAFGGFPAGTTGAGNIAISSDGNTLVWQPANAAAFYSTSNGTSWTAVSGLPAGVKPVADRVNPAKFYGYDAGEGKIYRSTDSGVTFAVASSGLPTAFSWELWKTGIKAVPGIEGELWICNTAGLYYSTDGGANYTQVVGINSASKVGFGKAPNGSSHPAVYIAGFWGGVYGFYRSTDMGASWVRINDSDHQYGGINDITGDPNMYGRVYLATNCRGVVYATTTVAQTGGDSEAPSTPVNLSAVSITQTSFVLSWAGSTDNIGVTGYNVYRNGVKIAETAATNYAVSGLSGNTIYNMTVKAKDAAGNTSDFSASLAVTTSNAATPDLVLYDEEILAGWNDWNSWAGVKDAASTAPLKVGSKAYKVSYTGAWQGFRLAVTNAPDAPSTVTYPEGIGFWAYAEGGNAVQLNVLTTNSSDVASTPKSISVPAGAWTYFKISWADLGSPTEVKSVLFQETGGAGGVVVNFDAIKLLAEIPPVTVNPDKVIYADALQTGWQNWSYAVTQDASSTAQVKVGATSLKVTSTETWGALSFYNNSALDISSFKGGISFWVFGETASEGATIKLRVYTESTGDGVPASSVKQIEVPLNVWTKVVVPWSELTLNSAARLGSKNARTMADLVQRITIQNGSSAVGQVFYIDQLQLSGEVPDPLPVRLVRFDAAQDRDAITLSWTTASESGSAGFEVEAASDAAHWNTIGFVASAGSEGNSAGVLHYNFRDNNPIAGINYYRLKQIDLNGDNEYSRIENVHFSMKKLLFVYPNPVVDEVTISFPDWSQVVDMRVVDPSGKVIFTSVLKTNKLDMKTYPEGRYLLQLRLKNGESVVSKIVKVH
ncbi:fibronectin type III domain-containing protein [Dyadobacter sp. MSC1_007]|jgi:hypothetical protein|uniref:fibronectin type III domain-containing protein n=1 Tax=Dyadobacter sp. MSC1_007 TaxID=2909264 RepID=UPI002030E3A2|nr:T9SS type A sorting domain-containing protein [Dyadobacter sp. MSC1_007]